MMLAEVSREHPLRRFIVWDYSTMRSVVVSCPETGLNVHRVIVLFLPSDIWREDILF